MCFYFYYFYFILVIHFFIVVVLTNCPLIRHLHSDCTLMATFAAVSVKLKAAQREPEGFCLNKVLFLEGLLCKLSNSNKSL